jgi:predicted porin
MKKSLVALAVLAAAGAASAQSSVTLFGVVDAGVSYYTVKSQFVSTGLFAVPAFTVPAGVKRSQTALSNSGYNSSRIGFRGTEDLGGGLAASFWLESGLTNDDGARGINQFNRRSTVSLSGGFGEVRLGRDYTPTFWNDTVFDPFGTNGVGTNLISTVNTNLFTARGTGTPAIGLGGSDTYVRTSNSIGYFLPPNLGGFYGQVQYALHENVKFSDTAGSPSKRGRYVGGRIGYANGPLDVAASYGQSTAFDTTTVVGGVATNAENKLKTANLGASYDFGVVKLFGEVSRVKDDAEAAGVLLGLPVTVSSSDKYTGALIGVTVPVGAGLIRAAYSRVKFKDDLGAGFVAPLFGGNIDSTTANKFAIGYVHNLSKRTALYATAARIRIKDGQNNPVIMGATTGGAPTYFTSGTYAPRTATGYDFGIRHAF